MEEAIPLKSAKCDNLSNFLMVPKNNKKRFKEDDLEKSSSKSSINSRLDEPISNSTNPEKKNSETL